MIELRIRVEQGDIFAGVLRIAGNVAALARGAEMASDGFFLGQVLIHVFTSFNVVRAAGRSLSTHDYYITFNWCCQGGNNVKSSSQN